MPKTKYKPGPKLAIGQVWQECAAIKQGKERLVRINDISPGGSWAEVNDIKSGRSSTVHTGCFRWAKDEPAKSGYRFIREDT